MQLVRPRCSRWKFLLYIFMIWGGSPIFMFGVIWTKRHFLSSIIGILGDCCSGCCNELGCWGSCCCPCSWCSFSYEPPSKGVTIIVALQGKIWIFSSFLLDFMLCLVMLMFLDFMINILGCTCNHLSPSYNLSLEAVTGFDDPSLSIGEVLSKSSGILAVMHSCA